MMDNIRQFDNDVDFKQSISIQNALVANGKTVHKVNTITSNDHTVADTNYAVLFSTGAVNRACTLPLNTLSEGRFLFIKKIDSGAGIVTITPNGGLIDGQSTFVLTGVNDSALLQSDGTNWNLVTSKQKSTYLTLVVGSETELLAAFALLNSTLGGGTIIFDADITLTTNRDLDHTEVIIDAVGHRLIFGGYYIRITSRTSVYKNIVFNGSVVTPASDPTSTLFKMSNATVDTSSFRFENCTFYDILGTSDTSTPIIDFEAAFAGSDHIQMYDGLIIGGSGTNNKVFCINQTGGSAAFSLNTKLRSYSNSTLVSSKFALIGSLHTPASSNAFITDSSAKYEYIPGTTLNVTNLQIMQGPPLVDYQSLAGSVNPSTDYLMLLDSTTYTLKKALVSSVSSSHLAPPYDSIQYNSAGAFGGSANFTYNGSVVYLNGYMGLQTSPTAMLHLGVPAGSPQVAPMKFTSGSLIGTPEAGAIEYESGVMYSTDENGVRGAIPRFIALGSAPTPTTAGNKGDFGYYAGYKYIWTDASVVIRHAVETSW